MDDSRFYDEAGLMSLPFTNADAAKTIKEWGQNTIIGHMGADWGSYNDIAGFNPLYNFSIVLTVNTYYGGNCDKLTGYNWF